MKNLLKTIYTGSLILIVGSLFSSCYKNFADAPYPPQAIYMPTAINGIYAINSVAIPDQTFRYTVDVPSSKFIVPLGVFRSGLNSDGDISVDISAKTDTVNKLINSGSLSNTLILPSTAYTIPSSVVVPSGGVSSQFSLNVDLGFLLANPSKQYAIAIGISSAQVQATSKNVTIVLINPAFLIPSANFTSSLSSTARQYNFTNTSVNTVSYNWNFGDGSAVVTDKAPSHLYSASGTYTVTLTATGAAGSINPSVKTATITVL